MTRRQWLTLPAGFAVTGWPAAPQPGFPGTAYREYSRCLPDFLGELAKRAYHKRNREILKLSTPEAIRGRQRWVRQTFWQLTGGIPERTPLNARTLGSFERSGYKVEKVLYESRPNFHIPANLYVPTSTRPPFPGVLFQMGHTLNGKAGDTYQCCCQALAQLGYLVLAFDPMGQGERVYYPNPDLTRTRLPSSDDEHTLPGKQMLLVGDTSTRMQVWDAIRSLDYLAAHPMVDPKRLASTGQSGGGTLTMLLLAVDDRLAAAAVCSGNTENFACANFNPPGSTDDAEQNFCNAGPVGFDRWDLLYPFAPKPLLISVSDKDFFGTYSSEYLSSGWEEYGKLKKVYERLGHADQLEWRDTPLPHGLSYDSRLQIYRWFDRHLKNGTGDLAEEPPVSPEPDATLWVTDTGNVIRSLRGETPFTLTKARASHSEPVALEGLLGVDRAEQKIRATILRRVPSRGLDVEALDIPSAPKVWLPAWLFVPKNGDLAKPVVIALHAPGRNVGWREGEIYQTLAGKGYPVCAADLRGIGDLSPEMGRGAARYARSHGDEENYSWAALMLGKPLLGQRVTDILAIANAIREHPALKGRSVMLAATGRLTVPALFAAALDPKINRLYLAGGLVSYRSILETENYRYPFANFVPDLLNHTDLPDVTASLAPRPVMLAGVVDAAGETLAPTAVRKIYDAAERAGNLSVREESAWDAESLAKD